MKDRSYITLEQAVKCLLDEIQEQDSFEIVNVINSIGRVTYEDIYSCINIPPFDRSPLDGYAVNHKDLEGASRETPVVLKVTQNIYAGDSPAGVLSAKEAARVMTGAPLPEGSDCVVRQEDTDYGEGQVKIYISHKKHENFCFKGEDVYTGKLLLKKGQKLDSAAVAVLSAQGISKVKVFIVPKVGVISTGSELIEPGTPLTMGKIYDSNSMYMCARIQSMGGVCVSGGNIADEPEILSKTVLELLSQCDLVITTGGVSVGEHDYMPKVSEIINAEVLFHGVKVKPGSPVLALKKEGKILLCLSGNPFAAATTFELLAVPIFRKLSGYAESLLTSLKGVLCSEFNKSSHGRRFIRAKMIGGNVFLPDNHSSGSLSSLIGCNCLIDIPAKSSPLTVGTEVDVVMLQ